MQFNMTEAKAQLSKLGELAWQGEEVVITKAGKPYLLLKPFREDLTPRKPGAWKGKVWRAPDFDDNREIIEMFENSKILPGGDV